MFPPKPYVISETLLNGLHFQPCLVNPTKVHSITIVEPLCLPSENDILSWIGTFFRIMGDDWATDGAFYPIAPPSVFYLAEAVYGRFGFSADDACALFYSEEVEVAEEYFEGAQIRVVDVRIRMQLHAWERVAWRFFKTAIQSAELSKHDIMKTPEWKTFLQRVDQIEGRLVQETTPPESPQESFVFQP